MKKCLSSFFLFFSVISIALGQDDNRILTRCGADLLHQKRMKNAKYAQNYNQLISKVNAISFAKNGRQSAINELIRIPVVVHVINNTENTTTGGRNNPNLSDEQIKSQIEVLNEDYRRLPNTMGFNTNPIGADMNIEFYLAELDPQGKPSTGIIRKQGLKTIYDPFNDADQLELAQLSSWPSECYLNIWTIVMSDQYLGYANFPSSEDFPGLEPDENPAVDGMFVNYKFFGRTTGTLVANSSITSRFYKFGRTVTHEVGHWLGLIHIWGDENCGDDYVDDTPTTQSANLTTNCNTKFSNCNGMRTTNMIENYMDYTIDSCMNLFTKGQANRVRAVFEASPIRKKLLECAVVLPETAQLEIKSLGNPATDGKIKAQILFTDRKNVEAKIFDTLGNLLQSQVFTDKKSFILTMSTAGLQQGRYILQVNTNNQITTQTFYVYN